MGRKFGIFWRLEITDFVADVMRNKDDYEMKMAKGGEVRPTTLTVGIGAPVRSFPASEIG